MQYQFFCAVNSNYKLTNFYLLPFPKLNFVENKKHKLSDIRIRTAQFSDRQLLGKLLNFFPEREMQAWQLFISIIFFPSILFFKLYYKLDDSWIEKNNPKK